jgi:hypothetical protein
VIVSFELMELVIASKFTMSIVIVAADHDDNPFCMLYSGN